ncbi:MAG: tyrosine-type recombinase/integrase, partial [Planctomycetaceae bacterium]|nr:tyrosine-type recombinase/integrase [Planctomycetaceae bacterium]
MRLRPSDVEDWLDNQYPEANNNGRNGIVRCVMRPFNWAVQRQVISKNPLTGISRPQPESREVYLDPKQWKQVIEKADGPLRELMLILRATGCRPFEARTVEARHVDRDAKAWVFEASESKGKRHRRAVPLNDEAWEITQRLMLKHPEGALFRNTKG